MTIKGSGESVVVGGHKNATGRDRSQTILPAPTKTRGNHALQTDNAVRGGLSERRVWEGLRTGGYFTSVMDFHAVMAKRHRGKPATTDSHA